MPSILFDKGREGILDTTIAMTGDIRVMLVKSAYVFGAAHQFLSDITAGNDNGRSASLASKTYVAGVFDAADTIIVTLAAAASNALVVYVHTGVDATARLIAYIDTATGLPFTPAAGQTVNQVFDNSVNKIFKL